LSGGHTAQATTGVNDPVTSATSGTSTTAVTATADPAITAASATSSAPSQCLPQSPPAPGCASAPVVTIGQPQTVTVHKTIDNLSGFNPVNVSDAVTWMGATEAPGTGANVQNPCVVGPSNTCTWANGTTCIVNPTGANPQTASVSPAVTLDFTFTATCTVDSFFDPHNPQQIVLLFQDILTATDTNITDSNPANNVVAPISLPFWSRSTFTPAFTWTISSSEGPNNPVSVPSTHGCVTNLAVFPGGLPCEMYETTSIPGSQPLALATTITPASFSFANGLTVPNGTTTGAFGFGLQILSCPSTTQNVVIPYPAVVLLDGALPDHTTLGDPGGNGPEGPDVAGGTAAILTNPAAWPTNLNSDPGVMAIVAGGAVIWERYTAIAPGTGTPVNILVFNAGATGWITTTVTGDPLGPPTPPGSQCTPFTTKTDYLGSTATGQVLRQCDTVGAKVFVAQFTRGDDYETTTVLDATNSCTMSATPTASPAPTETPTPTPTLSPTPTTRVAPTQSPAPSPTAAALPATGGMPSDRGSPWKAVGLLGAAISLFGLSLAATRRRRA
jgi:hypothetical protein